LQVPGPRIEAGPVGPAVWLWLVAPDDEPVWEVLAAGVELPLDDPTELWEAPPDVEPVFPLPPLVLLALVLPVLETGWEGAGACGGGGELW
jgi:hypothetical protein